MTTSLHLRTVGASAADGPRTLKLISVLSPLSNESVAALEDLGPIPEDAPTVVRLFGRGNSQVMTWLGANGRVVSDAAILGFADGILYERVPNTLPPRAIAVTPAAFVSAFATAKPYCDTSSAAIILGACDETRVVAAGLSRLGFKRILISDPDDAKTEKISQLIRKRLFGVTVQAISRSTLTQVPNTCSIAINLVGESEDIFLEDVSYLNFLRNSGSGKEKSGIWIDWTGATSAKGHADEISNAGAQILSADLIRAWRDVLLLEGVPGLIAATGRRPEEIVSDLLKTDPS
jgi:hypothetical protein